MKKNNILSASKFSQSGVLAVFWCIVVMLFSGSPYQTIFNIGLAIVPVAMVAFFLSLPTFRRINRSQIALLLLVLMVLVTVTMHMEFKRQFYWRFLCAVIVSYHISTAYTFSEIIKLFRKLMIWITLISLVGYFLANNTQILNILPRFENSKGVEFAIGIIFNFMTAFPERNCGIFWEPGIFATYLILAIVFEIFSWRRGDTKQIKSFFNILIFSIGLFTANSTAGFVLLFFCFLLLIVSSNFGTQRRLLANCLSVALFVLFFVVFLNLDAIILNTPLANNEYIVKLLSSNFQETARLQVLFHNWEVFIQNFWFGAGIVQVSDIGMQYADVSTPTYVLSLFGVLGFTYIIFIIKGVFQQSRLNLFSKIVFLGIFAAIICKEPHLEMLFSWILIFGLLRDKNAL